MIAGGEKRMRITRRLVIDIPKHSRLEELDDLMRVFCSSKRHAFKRLLNGEKKGNLIKKVNVTFHLNKRYAEDAVMQAEQIIQSQKELLPYQIENVEAKIEKTDKKIEDYTTGKKRPKKSPLSLVIKGLTSRLNKLNEKRNHLVQCVEKNTIPSVIFGGKKNFYARMKGKISNQEWKDLRSNMLYARGDKAKNGNLNTRIVYEEKENQFYIEIANPLLGDGSTKKAPRLRYKIHIPEKYFEEIVNVVMPDVAGYTPKNKVKYKYKPYSIEIKRKNGCYYIHLTYDKEFCGSEVKGRVPLDAAITSGIDVNIDRVTVCLVNRQGNLLNHKTFYCHEMEYVSSNRRTNIAGELAKEIIDFLLEQNAGAISLEDIKLKQDHDTNKRTNRLLHSFAKNKLQSAIISRGLKNGFKIKKVNPAYTSVIARFKYKDMYGMSTHEAASFVIARRGLGLDEKIPTYLLEYVQRIVKIHVKSALGSMEETEKGTEREKIREKKLQAVLTNIKNFKKNHRWKLWSVIHKTLEYNNQGIKLKEV
jgi:IS605 OrfB family transposase